MEVKRDVSKERGGRVKKESKDGQRVISLQALGHYL